MTRRRSGRRRADSRGRYATYIIVFLLLASALLIAWKLDLLPFTIITKRFGPIKLTVQVDPDVPIRITVNDWGKSYTFRIRATVEALRTGYAPAPSPAQAPATAPAAAQTAAAPQQAVTTPRTTTAPTPTPIYAPAARDSRYYMLGLVQFETSYRVHNPLAVPAIVKIPGYPASAQEPAVYPFAVLASKPSLLLDGQYVAYPSYYAYKYDKLVTTTTRAATTPRTTVAAPQQAVTVPTRTTATPPQVVTTPKPTTTTTTTTTASIIRGEYTLGAPKEGSSYYIVLTVENNVKTFTLRPGESKTFDFQTTLTVNEELYSVSAMIFVNIYVQVGSGEPTSLGFYIKAFETVPLSTGLHIQNVVTDTATGRVSYELVNDWITPLEVATGLIGTSDIKRILTVPAQGKVRVEFIDEDVRAWVSHWRPGDPTTYTKTISACMEPKGTQQVFFMPTWTCISALAVWRYNVPKVKIVLQTSGPGSVEMYADGNRITSGALVNSGANIRISARAGEGYVVGRMEVVKPDGSYIYVENLPMLPQDEYVKILKERSWSFIADHTRSSEYIVRVQFTRPSQVYVYTTAATVTAGTATYATQVTKVLAPEGEYRVDQNTLAASKTYISFRVRYHGYAEKDGPKDFPDPKNEFDDYIYIARGSMTVIIEAENTADRPVQAKATITLGGKQRVAGQQRIEVEPFLVPAGQKIQKEVSISLDGLWLTKPKGGSPYLPMEIYPMVKWADSPYASWVAAFSQMAIPQLFFDTAEKLWEARGGEYEALKTVIQQEGYAKVAMAEPVKATDAGIEYREVIIYKPENSLQPEAALGSAAYTASYQPVETTVEKRPAGEKEKTVAVIEPPLAKDYDTAPGVISLIPEPARKGLFDWITGEPTLLAVFAAVIVLGALILSMARGGGGSRHAKRRR